MDNASRKPVYLYSPQIVRSFPIRPSVGGRPGRMSQARVALQMRFAPLCKIWNTDVGSSALCVVQAFAVIRMRHLDTCLLETCIHLSWNRLCRRDGRASTAHQGGPPPFKAGGRLWTNSGRCGFHHHHLRATASTALRCCWHFPELRWSPLDGACGSECQE